MQELFGEEYMQEYGEKPIDNSFIANLKESDVKYFLEINHILFEKIKEENAFRKGTRRFKIISKLPDGRMREIIIGPHPDYCEGIPEMNDNTFINFFVSKFGMDFINYYIDIEKEKMDKRVKAFKDRCDRQIKDRMDYMIKILEKNS